MSNPEGSGKVLAVTASSIRRPRCAPAGLALMRRVGQPLGIVACGLMLAAGVPAATITVDTTVDAPVGSADSDCTLRSAIASADDDVAHDGCQAGEAGGDDIVFDQALAGSTLTLSEGQFEITEALTVAGPVAGDPAGIVIDADGGSRIFRIVGDSLNAFEVAFTGLTLTGGATPPDPSASGGAIQSQDADLRLDHVIVSGNTTTASDQNAHGGGVLVRNGRVEIRHSEIRDNVAAAGAAGGGLAVIIGEVDIRDTRIAGNDIGGDFANGGGVNIFRADTVMVNVSIKGNTLTGERSVGAGMSFRLGGHQLEMRNSTIADNTIAGGGTDARGGGLVIHRATATLVNTTVSGNSVGGTGIIGGGGIFVDGNDTESGELELIHASVVDNQADNGAGGIEVDTDTANVALHNTLVVQGEAGQAACNGPIGTAANTLATDDSCTGSATAFEALGIGELADNGGSTMTHRLQVGSAAIDAAGGCLADFGIDADQRGQPRPGSHTTDCDVGAFEFQGEVFADRFESN